jgi:hypothetical protein
MKAALKDLADQVLSFGSDTTDMWLSSSIWSGKPSNCGNCDLVGYAQHTVSNRMKIKL